jgi:hypothetical protein
MTHARNSAAALCLPPTHPPQAFARLSAVYGGTYMLNKSDAQAREGLGWPGGGWVGTQATARARPVRPGRGEHGH